MEVSTAAGSTALGPAAAGTAGLATGPGARPASPVRPAPLRSSRLVGTDVRSLYSFLTAADRALVEYATGQNLDPEPDSGTEPVVPFALHIARDREADRLKPNQEITVRYLWEAARQYAEAGVADNPFSGPVLERALAYLSANSAGLVDVTV